MLITINISVLQVQLFQRYSCLYRWHFQQARGAPSSAR